MTTPPSPPPGGDLRDTLDELLRSGSTTNGALNRLLDDYTTFHATLVVVGGCFLLALVLFTGFCWRQFRRTQPSGTDVRPLARKVYARFGLASFVISALLAVVVAANVSSTLDARQGLSGVADSLGTPPSGSDRADLQLEFATWLRSGDAATPAPIEHRVDARLAWQQPKAIISAALLVLVTALGALAWRDLLRRSQVRGDGRTVRRRGRLAVAMGAVPVCLVLMLMVMGNTQASVAPLTMTMLFG